MRSLQKKKNMKQLKEKILPGKPYLSASWLIFPRACIAASLISTTSQRSNGTTSLYKATGDAEFVVDDLSLRSAVNESGDEL
jgi:hypothetical protein